MFTQGTNSEPGGVAGISDKVDVFNLITNALTLAHLSEDRADVASTAAVNKLVFAGGANLNKKGFYDTVDIYNVLTGDWIK